MLSEPLVAMRSSCACADSCWRILLGQHEATLPVVLLVEASCRVPRRRKGQKVIVLGWSRCRACGAEDISLEFV